MPYDLTLHRLRVFRAVVEAGSISMAARRLRIPQPATSWQVRQLEAYFGCALLRRASQGIALTEEGRAVYRFACEVLDRLDDVWATVQHPADGLQEHLTVGAGSAMGNYLLPPILAQFRATHSRTRIILEVSRSREVCRRIHDRELDLGFVSAGAAEGFGDLTAQFLVAKPLLLVASAEHWDRGRSVSIAELAAQPFVSAVRGLPWQRMLEAQLRPLGIPQLPVVMEMGSSEATKEAVKAGAGLSFFFREAVLHELASGQLVEVQVDGLALEARFEWVHRADTPLSPLAKELLGCVQQALASS